MESSVQHDRTREVQIKQEECFYYYGLAHQSCFAYDKLDSCTVKARHCRQLCVFPLSSIYSILKWKMVTSRV